MSRAIMSGAPPGPVERISHSRPDPSGVAVTARSRFLEARRAAHRRKLTHQPTIMDHSVYRCIRATLQGIEISGRERSGRIIAVENRKPPSRANHPACFGKGFLWFRNVAQGRVKQHSIKATLLAWQSTAIGFLEREVLNRPRQFFCLGDEYREGSTPTTCETSGKPERKRVTAPVP
jgi:hypothetical protein